MANAPTGLNFGSPQGIAVDPTFHDRAVVVFTGFTTATPVTPPEPAMNRTRHVFLIERQLLPNGVEVFTDTDISGIDGGDPSQNLPDLPVYAVAIDSNVDPTTGQRPIIVGTEVGVFRTTDAGPNGAHWQVLGTGLPIVRCKSLAIDSSINPALLRVGTYGRSAFELKALTDVPTDVTAQMKITRTGFRFNHATNRFVQGVNVTNLNGFITGPLFIALDGLDSNTQLANRGGVTHNLAPLGSPFISIPGDIPQGSGVTVFLEFSNPPVTGITYSIRVLAGAGTP
jgi:hypothetical protein